MPSLLKPVAEWPLKLVAFDTSKNRDVSLILLASIPVETSAGTAASLEQARQRRLSPFAEIDGWEHGGLNE